MQSFAVFLLVASTTALSRSDSFVADRSCAVVPAALQSRLPESALGRLFEARRNGGEWHYLFWTKIAKTWVEEARVAVRPRNAYSSEVEVQVFVADGDPFGFAKPQPPARAEWTDKIRSLANE